PTTYLVFLFTHTTPTQHYTLSLHDALPISATIELTDPPAVRAGPATGAAAARPARRRAARHERSSGEESTAARQPHRGTGQGTADRKSTRLNSSHLGISYAVFCLKKKNKKR